MESGYHVHEKTAYYEPYKDWFALLSAGQRFPAWHLTMPEAGEPLQDSRIWDNFKSH